MTSRKLVRAWGAIRIRYPIFQTIRSHRALFVLFTGIFALALLYAVLWAYEIPQQILGFKHAPPTGIPDNLFSAIIEISVLLALGIGLLLWKTISSSENTRIDNTNVEIPDELIMPIGKNTTIEMSFDTSKHYSSPPILDACLRWSEFDHEELFLVEAGSLDIPKLTLLCATFDSISQKLCLELGSTSFYDVFCTHYTPDIVLSNQSMNAKRHDPKSLRALFGASIFNYYQHQIKQWQNNKTLNCSKLLPNPLGISGIVILHAATSTYILLQKRGSDEIAARNRLEWSFAGLIEATSWFHSSKIDFPEFVKSELRDEVANKATILNTLEYKIEPIGLVFNPLYLYQPEIFVAVNYEGIKDEDIVQIKCSLGETFVLVPPDQLSQQFQIYDLKNLCIPGLKLLQSAYPTLFAHTVHRSTRNKRGQDTLSEK